jgi:acyl carrier protein
MPFTGAGSQVVEEALFDAIARLGPNRADVVPDATFAELDLDSLDLIEIAQMAGETWGAQVDPQDFDGMETVGQAVALVVSRIP